MRLNWLCPTSRKPVGGIKILYRHASLVQKILAQSNHTSVIIHPNTISYKPWWFEPDIEITRPWFGLQYNGKPTFTNIRRHFSSENDFVIVPELWARKYGHQLAKLGIPFAIYVQGGYLIDKGDPNLLDISYSAATCILAISDDTADCIAMAFPFTANKIQRIHYSIDTQRYSFQEKKKNIITYMPRKLQDHIQKLLFLLRHHLPQHWKLLALEGLNENQVARHLRESKIFLSFSNLEGCPLPPLEAALSGNYVIGYTGQGGKEYWIPEIFTEIEHGNLLHFTKSVLSKIEELERSPSTPPLTALGKLSSMYSSDIELNDIKTFLTKIGITLHEKPKP